MSQNHKEFIHATLLGYNLMIEVYHVNWMEKLNQLRNNNLLHFLQKIIIINIKLIYEGPNNDNMLNILIHELALLLQENKMIITNFTKVVNGGTIGNVH
jgi:hypothetical protein